MYPLADFVCISPLSAWLTNFLSGTFFVPHFFVPITHIAYDCVEFEHDEAQRYIGKEVLIIGTRNGYKGWQGMLRSVSQDEWEVADATGYR